MPRLCRSCAASGEKGANFWLASVEILGVTSHALWLIPDFVEGLDLSDKLAPHFAAQ